MSPFALYVKHHWATHNGRSKQLRNLTFHAESISGKVFSAPSLFEALKKAEDYERALASLKG